MVYEVPASKASIKQNVFEFTLPGSDKVWSLPKARYISSDLISELNQEAMALRPVVEAGAKPEPEQVVAMMLVQQAIFDRYCPGLRSEVDSEQLAGLFKAWQEASKDGVEGIELGES